MTNIKNSNSAKCNARQRISTQKRKERRNKPKKEREKKKYAQIRHENFPLPVKEGNLTKATEGMKPHCAMGYPIHLRTPCVYMPVPMDDTHVRR